MRSIARVVPRDFFQSRAPVRSDNVLSHPLYALRSAPRHRIRGTILRDTPYLVCGAPLRHRRVPQKKCDYTSCCLRKQRNRVYSECTFFRGTRGAEHGEAGIEGALFFRLFLLGEQKKWPRLSGVSRGRNNKSLSGRYLLQVREPA